MANVPDKPAVPDNFPRPAFGVVAGRQPKVCVVLCKDGRYRESSSDEVRAERYEFCEDLAQQLCPIAINDAVNRSHDAVLGRVSTAVESKTWTSRQETMWVIERLRTLLAW